MLQSQKIGVKCYRVTLVRIWKIRHSSTWISQVVSYEFYELYIFQFNARLYIINTSCIQRFRMVYHERVLYNYHALANTVDIYIINIQNFKGGCQLHEQNFLKFNR